jgi:hypothetical protein
MGDLAGEININIINLYFLKTTKNKVRTLNNNKNTIHVY